MYFSASAVNLSSSRFRGVSMSGFPPGGTYDGGVRGRRTLFAVRQTSLEITPCCPYKTCERQSLHRVCKVYRRSCELVRWTHPRHSHSARVRGSVGLRSVCNPLVHREGIRGRKSRGRKSLLRKSKEDRTVRGSSLFRVRFRHCSRCGRN